MRLGTEENLCTLDWFTPILASHVSVPPTTRAQTECLTRGSGLKLWGTNITHKEERLITLQCHQNKFPHIWCFQKLLDFPFYTNNLLNIYNELHLWYCQVSMLRLEWCNQNNASVQFTDTFIAVGSLSVLFHNLMLVLLKLLYFLPSILNKWYIVLVI